MSNLVIAPDQQGFTPQQVATLKQLGVDKVSDGDLAVFFHQCVRTGLDPFAKQIYMVGRWDGRANATRYTIQTGIDGYRLIAERTGKYAGSDETWVEENGKPVSATVTVRKIVDGQVCNFTATARIEEYVQTGKDGKPMGLWAKMPHRMLAKCAEALALRKAFPQDLSGLYTAEEMSQADNAPAAPQMAEIREINPVVSADNLARFKSACDAVPVSHTEVIKTAGLEGKEIRESDMPALRAAFKKVKEDLFSPIQDAEIVEPFPSRKVVDVEPEPEFVEGFPIRTVADVEAELVDMFGAKEVPVEAIQSHPANSKPKIKDPSAPATPAQLGVIRKMARNVNIITNDDLASLCTDAIGRPISKLDDLTKGEASQIIDTLNPK
jgi:phage recombination protein Bet